MGGTVQESISKIWQEVLSLDEIDPDTSFFDIGGDSITFTLVVSRVRERLGAPIQMRALFDHPTLTAFSAVVQEVLMAQVEQTHDEKHLPEQTALILLKSA